MQKYQDLSGKKIGRYSVSDKTEIRNIRHRYYFCVCDCGKEKWVNARSLITGHSQSCGCLRNEKHSLRMAKPDSLKKTRIGTIYHGMMSRCYNSGTNRYKYYGGRGITVCDEWRNDFKVFYEWAMANGYQKRLQIDRRNNDGNYEPNNCRWIPIEENVSRKLNYMRVGIIRKLHRENVVSEKRLAEIYGVGEYSIHSIVTNKTWRCLSYADN